MKTRAPLRPAANGKPDRNYYIEPAPDLTTPKGRKAAAKRLREFAGGHALGSYDGEAWGYTPPADTPKVVFGPFRIWAAYSAIEHVAKGLAAPRRHYGAPANWHRRFRPCNHPDLPQRRHGWEPTEDDCELSVLLDHYGSRDALVAALERQTADPERVEPGTLRRAYGAIYRLKEAAK